MSLSQTAKELHVQMVDGKPVNGANAFTSPAVTIMLPQLITDQPDVIGFGA